MKALAEEQAEAARLRSLLAEGDKLLAETIDALFGGPLGDRSEEAVRLKKRVVAYILKPRGGK